MIFGFDTDGDKAICLAKEWADKNVGGGFLLNACGTEMASDALCDGIQPVLASAAANIQLCLEQIAASPGANDLKYAATNLAETCIKIHRHTLEVASFVGQGIYLSGVITYFSASQYCFLPFGGCAVYSSTDNILAQQNPAMKDRFIRDVIGGPLIWKPQLWQGKRKEENRLLITSRELPDLPFAEKTLRENATKDTHPNTVAMLLRRDLTGNNAGQPAAVMDLQF